MTTIALNQLKKPHRFNFNDIVFIAIIIMVFSLIGKGWIAMQAVFSISHTFKTSLDPTALPYYCLRTTIRLLTGMFFSLLFALVFGVLAAKYKACERVILPIVNFLESAPLIGFLTFTTVFFLSLYPNDVMGLECAAIFGVFTGQAWNMMLSVYQTLKIIPAELVEAADMFRYNAWQKFWIIELPYSIPGLLWNTMVSQSAAWFALIATESIPVGNNVVQLPGVGSYFAQALASANMTAVMWAVVTLIINVIIIDQLIFRPLVRFSAKFKYEDSGTKNTNSSWFYNVMNNSWLGYYLGIFIANFRDFMLFTISAILVKLHIHRLKLPGKTLSTIAGIWYLAIIIAMIYAGKLLWGYVPHQELAKLPALMLATALRFVAAMLLSVIIFVPLGVWIGLNPKLVRFFQPLIQIGAAIPINILFPFVMILLLTFHQSLNMWSVLLIMLGTQWYVLFNVIAGASTMPNQLLEVSKMFRVKGFLWWRKFMLPAIFPYIVCGIVSAAGGAWNTAIASEVVQWGKNTKEAFGLGAYIANATANNNQPQTALGCLAMCLMVAICVLFVWRPLYKLSETKFKIS